MEKSTTRATANRRSKSTLSAVLIFVVTFAVAFFATKLIFSKDPVDAELKKAAEEMNKNLPVQVDSITRLDKTEAFEGGKIQYNYTLTGIAKGDSTINIEETKKLLVEQSEATLFADPKMESFRKNKVEMKYVYKDKNGQFLFDFTVKPKK